MPMRPKNTVNELDRLRSSVTLARQRLADSFRSGLNIEHRARQYSDCLRDLRIALQTFAAERD